jgi:hypothetical protein
MKFKFQSKIEVDEKAGRKSLVVFYDSKTDDFDKAINHAMAFHRIKHGQMNVIALPELTVKAFY